MCAGNFAGWKATRTHRRVDRDRDRYTVTLRDPKTSLVVTCLATEYRDYPTVEWTLQFRNEGTRVSPILEAIKPLDVAFMRSKKGPFEFHSNTGDSAVIESYEPHVEPMRPGHALHFASVGGRPTNGAYPYWNLEGPAEGTIVVLSWGGQWAADIASDASGTVRVSGGQELAHFALEPGEGVSSPMGLVQFYQGDWLRGQNIWRRWMRAHNTPHFGGEPQGPMYYMNANGFFPGYRSSIKDETYFLQKFVAEGLPVGYWDLDAGWYPCDRIGWPETGTWDPDPTRFPNGIKPLSDILHQNNAKLILWFEPERVYSGTWLAINHPDWIYGGANGGLLKLGQPAARDWVTHKVSAMVDSQGIDVYRQDFNIDPLGYWRSADTPDRQGIAEIRHVEAYYRFWDDLHRSHPQLLIDTCASGGRRNNLETLRRSVPILRSDYTQEPIGCQGQTYGLSLWVPLAGTGVFPKDKYLARSCMAPIFGMAYDVREKGNDWERMRRMYADWKRLAPFMLADYWPLTAYSRADDAWIGWEWNRPESGDGMIQMFRRPSAKDPSRLVKLRGLIANSRYELQDLDSNKTFRFTGRTLMDKGVELTIPDAPGAGLWSFAKAR